MHDVARLAGVSIKTVSNVINDYPHVRPETRSRVQAAIDELDYHPNLSARGLRSGKTGVIGLAVPALRENYFAELADAIIRAAEKRGLGVVVEQTSGDRDTELAAVSGRRQRFMDGLLFSPVALGQQDAHVLDAPFPLVLLGERIFGGPTDHVAMHNVSAAEAAVAHLIDTGRRRIAVVGAAAEDEDGEASSASLRLRGYRRALEAAGIPFDRRLVRPAEGWNRQSGAAALHGLVADGVAFDAVFALNDTLGLGVLRALGEEHIAVPEHVAVIGFDDIDEARFSVPSLSSVETGREQIAEIAVRLLVERIAEKDDRLPPRTIKPDFTVVRRESS
ncbi:LacI family transcriptional regulator [Microbacterium sp. zg.Y1090]|uniref:LacI family DNA-binding transcriptional regulator n=1 Tax=Microbacterium TaxID=33882 RepID=UPI00214B4E39|nr:MULTISPECIES: LacI family DNA-binding transcriptional regulator [unclassified Microbacterium]MCR2812333.1 LacI family transcriptional regulator [Microbacterium sp. zg.Y1084]MCR2817866.1 LacI family transcriptional regulator [Microbacterium sp. zg.Y1090]MDL5485490.1 LacI family DNA-binding transcriptional regulator [Microbacterium sp. zg-Y1211]WIM28662.1 LacI family DNA-binding transcriptional regulator [Microbacterium sp. zg-Y1090]